MSKTVQFTLAPPTQRASRWARGARLAQLALRLTPPFARTARRHVTTGQLRVDLAVDSDEPLADLAQLLGAIAADLWLEGKLDV